MSKRIDVPYDILYDYYIIQQLTIRQCAKKLGRSHIERCLRRANIPLRPKLRTPNRILTKEWLQEKYVRQGLGLTECGKLAGCCGKSVLNALNRHNIAARPFQTPPVIISREWLLEHYIGLDQSTIKCAELLNCSDGTVQSALRKYGILIHARVRPGPKNHQWRGGLSFLPYCPKWTEELRESIREEYGRKCYLCPTTELENKRKLSVHHVNFDKMAGCYGKRWNLLPLCQKCHTKSGNQRFKYFNLLVNHWAYKYIQDGINI